MPGPVPPRVLLDACVLYPPILREILTGCAAAGLFVPLWSDRLLEEWARAARRHGPAAEAAARAAIAALQAQFPQASVRPAPGLESRLHLPDENDIHVLAAAITGNADAILTENAADFPRGALAAEGLARRDSDGFLWELWSHHPEAVAQVVDRVRHRAAALGATPPAPLRGFLRRARLPRLGKAMAAEG